MIVFSGTKQEFSYQISQNCLADTIEKKLIEAGGYAHNDSEYRSFLNSLPRMKIVLDDAQIDDQVDVAIEYQIPLTSRRVDFMIGGLDNQGNKNIIVIELKGWEKAKKTSRENVVLIETFTGGANRAVVHPSQQAYTYAKLIQNFNQAVEDEKINLIPCAFLHNYKEDFSNELIDPAYDEMLSLAPVYLRHDGPKLSTFIAQKIVHPSKQNLFETIENGKLRPSKALQDVVGSVLNGNREFEMIMEQQVAFATIIKLVENLSKKQEKHTVIVKGGPGTGKSVIAINVLARLINKQQLACLYVTKNSAPRTAFSDSLVRGSRPLSYLKGLFVGSGKFYNSPSNQFDCLLVDEAHRLKRKSGFHSSLGENQVKEIINAAKISVFFIDEDQMVTTSDIGTIDEIKRWAEFYGSTVHESMDLTLTAQFRCNGSDGYIAFLDNLLEIRPTANANSFDLDYDIRVFDNPVEMREELRKKNTNNKARMIAGYCYDWISDSNKNLFDIKLPGGFRAQWNFSTDRFAIDPESFEQVGCIYSTQGLEFDYVGIIIGGDLRFENGHVITDRSYIADTENSSGIKRCKDSAKADRLIKNIYKTLLSRGQKGCFIYCENPALADYLKKRIKNSNNRKFS